MSKNRYFLKDIKGLQKSCNILHSNVLFVNSKSGYVTGTKKALSHIGGMKAFVFYCFQPVLYPFYYLHNWIYFSLLSTTNGQQQTAVCLKKQLPKQKN